MAYGLLALIGIHVAAVLLMSVLTRENLARAMVTGRKRSALHPGARDTRKPGLMAMLLTVILIAMTVLGILRYNPAAFSPAVRDGAREQHEFVDSRIRQERGDEDD